MSDPFFDREVSEALQVLGSLPVPSQFSRDRHAHWRMATACAVAEARLAPLEGVSRLAGMIWALRGECEFAAGVPALPVDPQPLDDPASSIWGTRVVIESYRRHLVRSAEVTDLVMDLSQMITDELAELTKATN